MPEEKPLRLSYRIVFKKASQEEISAIESIITLSRKAQGLEVFRGSSNLTDQIKKSFSNGHSYLIAFSDGQPVGYILFKSSKGKIETLETFTRHDFSRRKIAVKMSLYLFGFSRSKGLRFVRRRQSQVMRDLTIKHVSNRRHYTAKEKKRYKKGDPKTRSKKSSELVNIIPFGSEPDIEFIPSSRRKKRVGTRDTSLRKSWLSKAVRIVRRRK